MNLFPITSIYAALAGILLLVLAWRVVAVRRRERIGLGDGQNRDLERRIRIHANAVEYVPVALILLALSEAAGSAALALHATGSTLIVARVLHAVGLTQSSGHSHGRFFGVLLTWLVILGLSLNLLLRPLLA